MTQFRKLARGSTLAGTAVCAFTAAWTGMSCVGNAKDTKAATQQTAQSEKDSKQAEARKAYDAGLKAFANGRYQPAVDQFSAALKSGGLSSTEMAKALYTRGVAYKRLKQPGLAISDLTSALWLKNGLSEGDRQKATAERAEAYQTAGIQDTGKGPERVIAAAPAAASSGANASSAGLSAAAIAQAAAQNSNTPNATPGSAATRQDSSSPAAQEAARARASYAPVDSLAGSTVTTGGAKTASSSAAPGTSFGSGVTGFFSNLFGGSSSVSSPEAHASVTTASTSPAVSETSSWSSATVVNEGHAASQMSHVTAHETKPRAHVTKGKYKVHIAALRSEAEADALAQKIVAQHSADLDNHVPTVDKAVIGSMGTFYRVRIGGYASRDEPSGLCKKLRTSGLDCLVVTN